MVWEPQTSTDGVGPCWTKMWNGWPLSLSLALSLRPPSGYLKPVDAYITSVYMENSLPLPHLRTLGG